MPVLYTKRRINAILKELGIDTIEGDVYTTDAAKILTWRAKNEHGVEHTYSPIAVRKHSKQLRAKHPINERGKENTRLNLIPVENVFKLRIAPERTNKGGKKQGIDMR